MDTHGAKYSRSRLVMLHQGALGDFLLFFPVLEGLYHSYPHLRMDFWSRAEHVRLIAHRPYVGGFHPSDGSELSPFYHESLWREAPVPSFFENAHTVFIVGQASGKALAERLAERLDSPVHWVRSFPGTGESGRVSEFIADQFERLGWRIGEIGETRLDHPRPEVAEEVRKQLSREGLSDPFVVLHPGSGGRRKIWPLGRWWTLLERIEAACRCPVAMTLGPADEYLFEFAEKARRAFGVRVLNDLSLLDLASLLSSCRLYVGNDSGVSHLAAVVGAPSLVLFGPTDLNIWAPRGARVRVVQSSWAEAEIMNLTPQPLEPQMEEALTTLLLDDGLSSDRVVDQENTQW
ncbi:MAG: glycosyltransferase family 9 protein, partial [Acidobacteriota bacterium]